MEGQTVKIKQLAIQSILVVSFLLTGCSNHSNSESISSDYQFYYEPVFEDKYDSFMNIDGYLDEVQWKNKDYLHFTEYGVNVDITTFFTKYGVFIGGTATDMEMRYHGRMDTKNNSGIDVFLARNDQVLMQNSEIMRLQLDAYDRKSYYQDRFSGQARVVGNLNTHTECKMYFEMFVSWKELGYKDYIPSTVKMVPSYRYIYQSDNGSNIERHNITPTFCEPAYMSGFYNFGESGYANPDRALCPLGDAKNGVNKSDGWDLSHFDEENPYVQSSFRNVQSIYFKNVCSENFVAEVDVEMIAPLGTANNPKFGLIAHGYGFMDFRAMYVRGIVDGDVYYKSKTMRVAEMTYYPERKYLENDYIFQELSSPLAETENHVHLKMIKNKDTLLMFVGKKLIYTETADWYKGEMSPGLFAMDVEAKFSNYRARELSEDELYEYCSYSNISIISLPPQFSGGSLIPNKKAVSYGEPLQFEIKPNVGFVLTDLLINNTSVFADYLNKVNGGVYLIDALPKQPKVEVEAIFKEIANSSLYCYGSVLSNGENRKIPYASLKITSNFNWLFFTDESSSSGSFYFDYLPCKGTEIIDIGGSTIYADGEYELFITSVGYRNSIRKIYVYEDGYHFDNVLSEPVINTDLVIDSRVVGGSVSSNNFSYVSDLNGWNLENEEHGTVIANRGSSNNPLYFSNVVSSKAVIKMTVQDQTPVGTGYDIQPSLGVAMQTGGFRLGVVLDGSNVRLLPDFAWYNDAEHLISSKGLFKTNDKNPLGFMLVKNGSYVAVLVSPLNDDNYQVVYAGVWSDFGNLPTAFSLYSRSSGLVNNVFSNYSIDTSSSAVDAVIDEYLSKIIVYNAGEYGNTVVKDNDGNIINSGDTVVIGSDIIINAEADEGYYLYGIRDNDVYLKTTFAGARNKGICSFAFTGTGAIEIIYKPIEELGKDIPLSLSSMAQANYLESVCTSTETVSGLHYATNDDIGTDSIEYNMQILLATSTSDYSQFDSIEYELIEGFTSEKMVPYVVDNNGHAFKIGGARNEWKANRIVDNKITTRQANNWQGFSITGGRHATYSVSLIDEMYYDKDVSNKFGATGESANVNLSSVQYLGIQTYAYYQFNWEFVLLTIKGVKSDGQKVMLFDGSKANVKNYNQDASEVSADNDAMLWTAYIGTKVNYQYLEAISNVDVKAFTGEPETWKIHYKNGTDGYAWNILDWGSKEKYVSLIGYDAIAFDLDFTVDNWVNTSCEMQIELRYEGYENNSSNSSRNNSFYLIYEDGTIEKRLFNYIPTNFKGTVICLFDDFTSVSNLNSHLYNISTSSRFIFKTNSTNNDKLIKISDFRVINNGKNLLG